MSTTTTTLRTLPWGEEIYLEIPLHKRSANKFYARHGKTAEGKEYIEFSKFGPRPNVEGETYSQKLRLFTAIQWAQLEHYVKNELATSIGWNLTEAEKEFKAAQQTQKDEPASKANQPTA